MYIYIYTVCTFMAQRGSHMTTLRLKYILYSYMDQLGKRCFTFPKLRKNRDRNPAKTAVPSKGGPRAFPCWFDCICLHGISSAHFLEHNTTFEVSPPHPI